MNHLGSCWNTHSDSVGLAWDLRLCSSNKLQSADAAGPWTTLWIVSIHVTPHWRKSEPRDKAPEPLLSTTLGADLAWNLRGGVSMKQTKGSLSIFVLKTEYLGSVKTCWCLCPTCWDPGSGCDLGIGRLKSFSDDPKGHPRLGPTALKGQYSLEVLVYGLRQEVWEKRCPFHTPSWYLD